MYHNSTMQRGERTTGQHPVHTLVQQAMHESQIVQRVSEPERTHNVHASGTADENREGDAR